MTTDAADMPRMLVLDTLYRTDAGGREGIGFMDWGVRILVDGVVQDRWLSRGEASLYWRLIVAPQSAKSHLKEVW